MKKLQLFLLFITLISRVFAQTTTSTVYNDTTDNNKFITFEGFYNQTEYGKTAGWLSVMQRSVDHVFLSMKDPVYAKGYKPKVNQFGYKFTPKTKLILGMAYSAENNKSPSRYTVSSFSKTYSGYVLSNVKSAVAIIGMGINKHNLKDYRFRVIENDSVVLVQWTIPKMQQKYGAKQPYGYFGDFYSPSKEITVEVVNIKDYNQRDGIVLNWRNYLKPELNNVIGYKKGKVVYSSTRTIAEKQGYRPLYFDSDSIEAINLSFKDHPSLPYDIYLVMNRSKYRATTDTIFVQRDLRENVFSLSNQYFIVPGSYKLLVYPVGTKDKNREAGLSFNTISLSTYARFYTIMQMLPYFLLALLAFAIYYLFNKRRVRNLKKQKEIATLKLGSVRAQLNPHFMFNALTSIQNLVNQQDTVGANHYLTKFADLTRQVLNVTSKELISLEDELKIIEDYLQIEQLRFGFTYNIDVDKTINIANTEVPGMLMQPFIENAAKHGISGKLDKGRIDIRIRKQQNNLLLTITDNGKGFDVQANVFTGFGLKLGHERVALLNQIYKSQPIKLQIDSSADGTRITILLTAWLQ